MLCKEGRIPGAYKDNKRWLIPNEAEKPVDKRLKGRSRVSSAEEKITGRKLPLPIGISDYRKASGEYYYVDKTLLIRDFIDERPQVSLFTRPRRFGKTLNMDMLRVFFECSKEDTSVYFKNKKIWKCGKEYQDYQGKYPVIYVTFKDVKCDDWENAYDLIYKIIRNEIERHSELLNSDKISAYEKKYLTSMLNGEANENDVAFAFLNLSRMLHTHYGVAPIIIVDEYDTPIQQGHVRGYYDQVIDFMRALFSGGLKDNPHLSYGFLTGILRVAKESIFSGLNNLKINSILDNRYSEYFGFTPEEVREMAQYYGVPEKYDEICEWYDGYRFGKTEIFNPWSVIGYFNNECVPRAFWQSTGSNDIISEVLNNATMETYEKLESLLQGKSFVVNIDTWVIYPQIQSNPASVYSFLLVTGYLNAVTNDQPFGEDYMCEVAIPNKEISYVYSKEILSRFENVIPQSTAGAIQTALYTMDDTSQLKEQLEKFQLQTVSFHDTAKENFYRGLILGLGAIFNSRYQVSSNREAGNGRFDICMIPFNKRLTSVLQYGIAFSGKNVCIKGEERKL